MLTTPNYILAANIATTDLHFEWDEWNVQQYYFAFEDDDFVRLGRLTGRANGALTFAIGEWILHRFSLVSDDPTPAQYLEAAWVGNVHRAYFVDVELIDDAWRGPVRGPLSMMMSIADDVHSGIEEYEELAARPLWMRNLALHVLGDRTAFDTWFEICVQRLEQYHRKDMLDEDEDDLFSDLPEGMGKPVPREAFDPDFAYNSSMDVQLIDSFLRSLQPAANEFLYEPHELSDVEELQGTLYRYFG